MRVIGSQAISTMPWSSTVGAAATLVAARLSVAVIVVVSSLSAGTR